MFLCVRAFVLYGRGAQDVLPQRPRVFICFCFVCVCVFVCFFLIQDALPHRPRVLCVCLWTFRFMKGEPWTSFHKDLGCFKKIIKKMDFQHRSRVLLFSCVVLFNGRGAQDVL